MTAVLPDTEAERSGHALDVSFARVCHSEWTKFRSVRSTWWLAILTVLLIVGIGLFSAFQTARHADGDPYYQQPSALELAKDSQNGAYVAVLAVLVLAALFITGEYGTGMIRSSLTVVPRRTPVLLGKALLLAVVFGVATTLAAVLSFLGSGAIWSAYGRAGASFGDPGVPSVVLGVPLYLSLAAVFALAVGVLVRNTAAALTVVVGVFFVAPVVLASWHYTSYLPSNAGATMTGIGFGDSVSGAEGMSLFAGYTAALLALAATRLRRSDV